MAGEKRLVERILRRLNALPRTRAVKNHGGMYGRGGEPDIFGCTHGLLFVFEVKLPGQALRPRQKVELRRWESAGATAARVDDVEDAVSRVIAMAPDAPASAS